WLPPPALPPCSSTVLRAVRSTLFPYTTLFRSEVTGFTNMVNYGSERLRFPSPVPAGSLVHSRTRGKSVEVLPRGTQMVLECNIHVVGQERPAVINDLVILYM